MAAEENSSQPVLEQSESVAATQLGVIGQGPAWYTNQGYQLGINAAAGYLSLNQAMISKATDNLLNTSVQESAGTTALAGILGKMMQTFPPVSAGQPVANQG